MLGRLLLRYKTISLGFLLLGVLYIGLSLFVKADPATLAKYHITASQLLAITLTFAIPYLIIWFIALRGYLGLRSYVDDISDSPDGKGLSLICHGVFLLALWLPFTSVISSLASLFYTHHHAATASLIRIDNYANLLLLFAALLLIYRGARRLIPLVRRVRYSPPQLMVIIYICFAVLYTYVTLLDPAREFAKGSQMASYYLPDWLTVLTIIIPRLIQWYLGFLAVHALYFYRQHVKGVIYRSAFDDLAKGLSGVIAMTVVLRFLQSLNSQLLNLSLGAVLLVIYLLLVVIAIGYVYIMRGTTKLQRIEGT